MRWFAISIESVACHGIELSIISRCTVVRRICECLVVTPTSHSKSSHSTGIFRNAMLLKLSLPCELWRETRTLWCRTLPVSGKKTAWDEGRKLWEINALRWLLTRSLSSLFDSGGNMALSLLDIAICSAALLIFHWLSNRGSRRSSLPLPPCLPGLPVIGNLRDLQADENWLTFLQWGKAYSMFKPLIWHILLLPSLPLVRLWSHPLTFARNWFCICEHTGSGRWPLR